MKLTPKMALEVVHHEAMIRQTYFDSVGVATWSVGLTSASGHNVERYMGKPQTMQKCLEVFLWALERYADDVRKTFKGHTLTEAQFTAALSFHWNTGRIKTASWVKRYKAGDIRGARAAFMFWNKPASIIDRRQDECDLFFDGRWSGDGKMTEYTELTSRRTPNWRSGVRRDVSSTIADILSGPVVAPPADYAPDPHEAPVPFWAGLISALLSFFRKENQ